MTSCGECYWFAIDDELTGRGYCMIFDALMRNDAPFCSDYRPDD